MEQLSHLHTLAQQYETQLKEAITEQFSVPADELRLLTDREDCVYISEVDPSALCCLAVGGDSGFLYQVIANIDENHETLTNFVAGTIA